jgi:hypothetical protein
MKPTPETDKFFATFADGEAAPSHAEYYTRLQDLERERDEAREQLALTEKNLEISMQQTKQAVQDRADEHIVLIQQRDEARGLEAMYQKVVAACLRCDPIPACQREDGQLEPPWEVIDRIRCERDEARGQRDRLAELHNKNAIHFNELLELCGTLRKERDRLAKALRECREDSVELLGERDWWQNETRLDYQKRYRDTRDNIDRADDALQSLTPKQEP